MTTFRSSGKTQQIFHWSREQFQTIFSITFVVAMPETSTFLHQTTLKPKRGPWFMEPRKGCLIALASAFRFVVVVVGFIVKQYKLYIIFFSNVFIFTSAVSQYQTTHCNETNEKISRTTANDLSMKHLLRWKKKCNKQPTPVDPDIRWYTHRQTLFVAIASDRQTVEYIGTDKADMCLSDCRFSLMYFNCFGLNFH